MYEDYYVWEIQEVVKEALVAYFRVLFPTCLETVRKLKNP
jgi:hypothetical protein